MNDLLRYDLKFAKYDNIIQCHATSPLLSNNSIKSAIQFYCSQNIDSLFSVTEYKSRFYDLNFKAINHEIDKLIKTQDLTPIFEENSAFYIFTKNSF